jgi:cyclophilin family peptidyl-prolyl cis-trans isomerase
MQTNLGSITMQLNLDKAPITSKNFLNYVNSGFYKNTLFHRSVKDFIIQGGGYDASTITSKPRKPTIPSEANNGLSLITGSVSMALSAPNKVTDNHSATSEFFINVKDNTQNLTDASSFTVFAQVISGMDIVSKINSYPTISLILENLPLVNNRAISCGLNICLQKIYIENIYTSKVVDSTSSITRVTVNGTGGKITSLPAGISCTSTSKAASKTCVLTKALGTPVSLISTPSKGYEMRGWSGDCQGFTTPLVLDTKTKNNNCTATFAKIGS